MLDVHLSGLEEKGLPSLLPSIDHWQIMSNICSIFGQHGPYQSNVQFVNDFGEAKGNNNKILAGQWVGQWTEYKKKKKKDKTGNGREIV